MSLRALGAFAISLVTGTLIAPHAMAKSCYCEVAVGCPRDAGHVTLRDFDAIDSYGAFESHKKAKCSASCGQRSRSEEADIRANGEAWCDRLGLGHHLVRAWSVVGHTDNDNNWCDPDDVIGTLVCERICDCPPGYDYDAGSGLCHGTCDGLSVATFPTDCGVQHHWQ